VEKGEERMVEVDVYHYNAFGTAPDKGNPAGVVLDASELDDEHMLAVARQVGYNETAFVLPSETADLRIRFFTPGHEVNLCGHATIATLYALASRGILNKRHLTLETKAGVLPIRIDMEQGQSPLIYMKQAPAQFRPFEGSLNDLAGAIGLTSADLDDELPVMYGSTGIWTLLVPVKRLESFRRMSPRNGQFPSVLTSMPRASVHPFCLETYDPSAQMHGRHFSSPYSGTVEDPVTGTASGVMGAYYARYIRTPDEWPLSLVVEQGHEIGREGNVRVEVNNAHDRLDVTIAGTGVYVRESRVHVESRR
jgi:PhzF family phenazine biosynthesis protein